MFKLTREIKDYAIMEFKARAEMKRRQDDEAADKSLEGLREAVDRKVDEFIEVIEQFKASNPDIKFRLGIPSYYHGDGPIKILTCSVCVETPYRKYDDGLTKFLAELSTSDGLTDLYKLLDEYFK